MSKNVNQLDTTRVITGMVRFSYLHVFAPRPAEDGEKEKYSVSIIIPKEDKETIAKLKKGIKAAAEYGAAKFGGKIPANLKTPLRDGDEERPEDEAYANSFFMTANSNTKPGLVDKNVNPILEQNDLYSGCYGRADVTFFAYNTNGNKGIACGLNNLQKIKDGEPLGGRTTAESAFGGDNAFTFDDDNDDNWLN